MADPSQPLIQASVKSQSFNYSTTSQYLQRSQPHMTASVSSPQVFPQPYRFPSFTIPSLCISFNKWVVVKSKALGKQVIMLGDKADYYDNVVSGSFYLKTYYYDKGYYKPVFCEDYEDGESCCKHIGVQFDVQYFRRLVVRDHLEPLIFKFVMVEEEEDSFALEDSPSMRSTW